MIQRILLGASVATAGFGMGLLWIPAERAALNPYRSAIVGQVCKPKGQTVLGVHYDFEAPHFITRFDQIVAGTPNVKALCGDFSRYPVPGYVALACFLFSILLAVVLLIATRPLRLPIVGVTLGLMLVAVIGVQLDATNSTPNSKSNALAQAYSYWRGSPSEIRESLAKDNFSPSDIEYAMNHLQVDTAFRAHTDARLYLNLYPESDSLRLRNFLESIGYDAIDIAIALDHIESEQKQGVNGG